MANLTATLADVTPVTNIVSNDAGPGGASTAIAALAKGLGALTDSWDNQVRMKRQAAADARQAKADLRADTADVVTNDTLIGLNQIQNNSFIKQPGSAAPVIDQPVDNGLPAVDSSMQGVSVLSDNELGSLSKSVDRMNTMQSAVEQGRMPSISKNAQFDLLRNQLFEKYGNRPGALEQVAKIAKEQGIDLFPDISAEQDFRDAQTKAKTDEYFKTIDIGKSLTPFDPSITDQQYYVNGRQFQASEAIRIATKNAADAQSAANSENREGVVFDQKQESLNQFSDGQTQLMNNLGPAIQVFQRLADAGPGVGQSAAYETKLAEYTTKIQTVVANSINSIVANVRDPSTASALRSQLETYAKTTILDPVTNRRQEFTAAAGVLGTAFKLRMQEAAPVIRQMQSMGLDMKDLPDAVNALPADLQSQVSRELAFSLNPKLEPDVGKMHLVNAIAMLKGEKSLNDMDSRQGRQIITSVAANYTRNGATAIASGNGNPEHWLNAAGQMPAAAASVNRGSGPDVLGRAMAVLVGPNQINALDKLMSDPRHGDQAKLVAVSSRAGVAHLTQETHVAANKAAAAEYQIVYYNRDKAAFEFRFNDAAWRKANPRATNPVYVPGAPSYAQGAGQAIKPTAPSAALRTMLSNLNNGVMYLTKTTKWEPGTAPNGSMKDVAEFWATGETVGTTIDKGSAPRKQEGNAIKAIDAAISDLGDPSRFLQAPDAPGTSRGERNNNPGNLEYGSYTKAAGATGSDGRFAIFPSMSHGVKAQENLLVKNYINKGRNTVTKVLEKYAPRSDNQGSFDNYVAYVAKRLNINPNDTITPAIVGRLAQAMREFETGKRSA